MSLFEMVWGAFKWGTATAFFLAPIVVLFLLASKADEKNKKDDDGG